MSNSSQFSPRRKSFAIPSFAIHSATKGVGLLPRLPYLNGYVDLINECLSRCADRPPDETLQLRVETARSLYERPERIDDGVFGSIEIFRGRTYRNLLNDPQATLLFTSPGPDYLSYQLNCITRVVDPDDPAFRFIRGMRLLFEMERFHIQQPAYPLGYVFGIQEVFDKTPKRVGAGQTACGCPGARGRMPAGSMMYQDGGID